MREADIFSKADQAIDPKTSFARCSQIPPPWTVIRRLLRNLPSSHISDEELDSLKISVSENVEPPISLVTHEALTSYMEDAKYGAQIKILGILMKDIQTPAKRSLYIESLLGDWLFDLGEKADIVKSRKRPGEVLRFRGDTHSKGVRSQFHLSYGNDSIGLQKMSLIVRTRRRREFELTSTELYALLSLALQQWEMFNTKVDIKVHLLVVHTYWAQKLTATIPSVYLQSILAGDFELAGYIKICRTPWYNMLVDMGRRDFFLRAFESTSKSDNMRAPSSRKRKLSEDDGVGVMKKPRSE